MIKQVRVGQIVRAFGLKGEVKVKLYTDIPEERFKVGRHVHLEKSKKQLVVSNFRMHQNHALLTFEGFNNIDDVSSFIFDTIMVEVDSDKEERIAQFDLMGCDVNENGEKIGEVIEVMDTLAHAILRVKTPTNTVLIPYVDAFIVKVDKKKRVIHIQSIEGLL